MILFTDFVPDESITESGNNLKTEVGWSLVACLAANLALNISLILRELILKVINACKTQRAEAAKLQQIKEAEQTLQLQKEVILP